MNLTTVVSVVAPIVAVVGILVVVAWATGGTRATRIVEIGEVHQAVLDADMAFVPAETVIGADGLSALITSERPTGLAVAYVVGNKVAARTLSYGDVRSTQWTEEPDGSAMLQIHLRDFGCPELVVRLRHADVERWRPRVGVVLGTKT